jgi:HK97 gp10 family phage protein
MAEYWKYGAASSELLDVRITGIEDVNNRIKGLEEGIRKKAMEQVLRGMAMFFRKETRKNIKKLPITTTSNTLYNSVKVEVEKKAKRRNFRQFNIFCDHYGHKKSKVQHDAFFARWIERGTKGHLIKPQFKEGHKAIAYTTKQGKYKVRLETWHPGFKEKPFMRPAFDDNWRKAIQQGAKRLDKWIDKRR